MPDVVHDALRRRAAERAADERGGLRLPVTGAAAVIVSLPLALLLLLVEGHWAPLQRLDIGLDERLNAFAYGHPAYVSLLRGVSAVGSPTTFKIAAVVVAVGLTLRRQPRLAAWLVVSVVGGNLLSDLVKSAVGRRRPSLPHPVAHALSASFPSGHALGSVVGVGALLLVGLPYVRRSLRRPLIGLGAGIIVSVGFSRLGLGVHYLSDVLGGYLLGIGWLAATGAAFAAGRSKRGVPRRRVDRDPGPRLGQARW